MEIDKSRGLIVFLKPPGEGSKTRLARDVGNAEARTINKQLVKHTLHVINGVNAFKYIFLTAPFPGKINLPKHTFSIRYQQGNDLGERMHNAFTEVFDAGVSRAVIIGSDNIQVIPPLLNDAFEALLAGDMVIGPSNDGGYYLLGLNEPQPSLFEAVQWSTDSVLETTLAKAATANMNVIQLETLADIDHWADLEASNWRNFLDQKKNS
jgi:rSAM/selenodomain-associated transferase 1